MQYLFVFIAFFIFTSNAFAEKTYKRVALVIGNSKYIHATKLNNPPNDARKLAEKFRGHKFDKVVHAKELTRGGMIKSLREFRYLANKADIAVIYFSGHGMEMEGVNYLVPVDAKLETEYDVKDEAVTLDRILEAIKGAGRLQLIILDACRNNPFKNKLARSRGLTRSQVTRGFVPVEVSGNVMVAYAAKGGTVAYDGKGENSPFAQALLDHLFEPGLDIRIALGRVRDSVSKVMSGRQIPWHYGSLGGNQITLLTFSAELTGRKEDILSELRKKAQHLGEQIASLNSQMQDLNKDTSSLMTGAIETDVAQITKTRVFHANIEKKNIEQEIRDLEIEISWEKALGLNQQEAYEYFLSSNPDSVYAAAARERIAYLKSLKKKWNDLKNSNNNSRSKLWSQLEHTKNLRLLDKFFRMSSNTKYADVSYLRLKSLAKKEEADWKAASSKGVRQSFQGFLKKWPDGFFAGTAKKKISEKNLIEQQWKKIISAPTINSLSKFVEQYGDTEFGPEATVALVNMKQRNFHNVGASRSATLSGKKLAELINGKKIRLRFSNAYVYFDTNLTPAYRKSLGKNYLQDTLGQDLISEGAFKAEYWQGKRKVSIEGIAGIVTSKLNNNATLYLIQMYGNETSSTDINKRDRKYATFQLISSPTGYVCNGTLWQSVRSNKNPSPVVDQCVIK